MNESKTDKETYRASNDDLPTEMFADPPDGPKGAQSDPPRRCIADARYEVAKQAHELGLSLDDQQIGICAIILFAHWQDEVRRAS